MQNVLRGCCGLLAIYYCLLNQFELRAEERFIESECYRILHNQEAAASTEQRQRCLEEYQKSKELTVLVSASRTEEQLKDVPAAAAVIGKKQLQRQSSDSVAEIVRDVPGVDVSDAGEAGLKRIRIRGEDAARVALRIDGQEFSDQRDVGTPLLVAPEMIERVEVLRGPASVLHGSRAIGGVVNVITKKGGFHPLQAEASSAYDSATNGTQNFAALFGSHKDFDYRLAVSTSEANERHTPAGDLENTSFENEALFAYLAKRIGKDQVGFQYDTFDAESDIYVEPAVRFTAPFKDFRIDAPQRDREKYAVFYEHLNEDPILRKLRVDAYYQNSDRQFNTFSDTFFEVPFPLSSQTTIETYSTLDTIGTNIQADLFTTETNLIIVGFQSINDELEQNRDRSVVANSLPRPHELTDDHAALRSYALYAADEWQFADEWSLTSGVRNYWFENELEYTTRPGLETQRSVDNEAVGSAALAFQGFEDTTVWAKFAQGFVYPSLTQSGTGAFAGPNYVNPNFDLEPENSYQVDLGARYDDSSFRLDGSLFFSEAKDYIDHVLCSSTSFSCIQPSGSRDRVYVNIDEAQSFGAEGSIAYSTDFITPYVNVTWIRRRFERDELRTYETGLAPLSARVGLRSEDELDGGINLWGDLFVRAETDSDELSDISDPEAGLVHKAGWATLNLAGGVEFGPKGRYRLSLELLNLTDKLYTASTENLYARGASAILKLSAAL